MADGIEVTVRARGERCAYALRSEGVVWESPFRWSTLEAARIAGWHDVEHIVSAALVARMWEPS